MAARGAGFTSERSPGEEWVEWVVALPQQGGISDLRVDKGPNRAANPCQMGRIRQGRELPTSSAWLEPRHPPPPHAAAHLRSPDRNSDRFASAWYPYGPEKAAWAPHWCHPASAAASSAASAAANATAAARAISSRARRPVTHNGLHWWWVFGVGALALLHHAASQGRSGAAGGGHPPPDPGTTPACRVTRNLTRLPYAAQRRLRASTDRAVGRARARSSPRRQRPSPKSSQKQHWESRQNPPPAPGERPRPVRSSGRLVNWMDFELGT
jgi:hypothetical protein